MDLNIDKKIAVALRRIIMQNIPHYCFDEMIIYKNNTLLDNDHLKKRIINIPVENLFIDIKQLKQIDQNIIINNDFNIEISLDQIQIKCNKKYNHENNSILQSVTTDDFEFFLNKTKIKNPYKNKIKLVDLKYENDEIDFTASTNINIPLKKINYSVSETPILITSDNMQKLFIYPISDSITSQNILKNSIYILKVKLDNLLLNLKNNEMKEGKIIINNDLFTLGYLLSYFLNKDKDVSFCSINTNTLIEKDSNLNFCIKKNCKKGIYNITEKIIKNIKDDLNKIII